MAEAPNFLLFLSLTSILNSVTSYLVFCEMWTIIILLCVVRHKWHQIAQQAVKSDRSTRKMDRHRTSTVNHLRYHRFKQRMKYKHVHKGKYIKPKPLFYLTWKFKAIKLTVRAAASIYLAGCRVERLVGHSSQLLLYLSQLCHRIALYCRMRHHAIHQAFRSTTASSSSLPYHSRFDTDSFRIGVDTLCSVTMSGKKECFKDLKPSEGATIVGMAGGLVSQGTGIFCFNIEDDSGFRHHIELPNSLYIPGLPQTLLCPQHWAQVDADNGTYITNTAKGCWLVWNKE